MEGFDHNSFKQGVHGAAIFAETLMKDPDMVKYFRFSDEKHPSGQDVTETYATERVLGTGRVVMCHPDIAPVMFSPEYVRRQDTKKLITYMAMSADKQEMVHVYYFRKAESHGER